MDDFADRLRQRRKFLKLTQAAHYGKRPVDWLALESTQEYVATLCELSNCEKSSLLKTKAGRHNGGTWFHPKLAVPLINAYVNLADL